MPVKRKASAMAEADKTKADTKAAAAAAPDTKSTEAAASADASAAAAAAVAAAEPKKRRAASVGKKPAKAKAKGGAAAAAAVEVSDDDTATAAAGAAAAGGDAKSSKAGGSDKLTAPSACTGHPVPAGWKWNGTCLYYLHPESKANAKLACFDYDGCLAKTSLFKKGPDAWSALYPEVVPKLKALHDAGFRICIFTNQSEIGKAAKPEGRTKQIAEKIGRLTGFAKLAAVPISIFIATAKASAPGDAYRKPAVGMWTFLTESCNDAIKPDMTSCFFVGDAAGRKGDHSDVDKAFAAGVPLTFHTQDAYFLGKGK